MRKYVTVQFKMKTNTYTVSCYVYVIVNDNSFYFESINYCDCQLTE